jgi:hypothetical protein
MIVEKSKGWAKYGFVRTDMDIQKPLQSALHFDLNRSKVVTLPELSFYTEDYPSVYKIGRYSFDTHQLEAIYFFNPELKKLAIHHCKHKLAWYSYGKKTSLLAIAIGLRNV